MKPGKTNQLVRRQADLFKRRYINKTEYNFTEALILAPVLAISFKVSQAKYFLYLSFGSTNGCLRSSWIALTGSIVQHICFL